MKKLITALSILSSLTTIAAQAEEATWSAPTQASIHDLAQALSNKKLPGGCKLNHVTHVPAKDGSAEYIQISFTSIAKTQTLDIGGSVRATTRTDKVSAFDWNEEFVVDGSIAFAQRLVVVLDAQGEVARLSYTADSADGQGHEQINCKELFSKL